MPEESPPPIDIGPAEDDEDSPSEGSGSFEGSNSVQMETSSEGDIGIEIIQPTTKRSVILTTSRPELPGSAKGSANYLVLSKNFTYLLSFLFLLRV